MICPNCGTKCDDGVKECILCGYFLGGTGVFSETGTEKVEKKGAATGAPVSSAKTTGGENLTIENKPKGKSKKRAGIIAGLCAGGGVAAALIILFAVTGHKSLSLEEQLESLQAKAETVSSLEEAEKIYKEAEEIQNKIEESIEASSQAKAQSELASIQAAAESASSSQSEMQSNEQTNTQTEATEATFSGSSTQTQTTAAAIGTDVYDAQPATIITKAGNILNAGQVDSYTFDAPNDGRYRAEITEMGSRESVDLEFCDAYGNVLEYQYGCRNGDGVTVKDLVAGSRYEVRVSETAGNTPYLLSVGLQKAPLDISNAGKANDSVEYTDQRNLYNFTPSSTGDYRFEISDADSGILLDMFAFDEPGNKLDSIEAIGNGKGLTLKNLKGGEEYEIQVRQSKGLGGYSLLVK